VTLKGADALRRNGFRFAAIKALSGLGRQAAVTG
jgi:hypothetical protein